jgi:hypothetical protein
MLVNKIIFVLKYLNIHLIVFINTIFFLPKITEILTVDWSDIK